MIVHQFVEALPPQQAAAALTFLKQRPVYPDCHVRYDAGAPGPFDSFADKHVLCSHNHDVLRAPHLLEHALRFTRAAAFHVGRNPPVLYSCNCFWTRPGGEVRPDIQDWHQDIDDARFLAVFILLTSTRPYDGPQQIRVGDMEPVSIWGPAGTTWLADTSNWHRGLAPRFRERCLVWFRWGVSDVPTAYSWDKLEPMDKALLGARYPADPALRESIKLLVA